MNYGRSASDLILCARGYVNLEEHSGQTRAATTTTETLVSSACASLVFIAGTSAAFRLALVALCCFFSARRIAPSHSGPTACDYLTDPLREFEIIDWRNLIWAANQRNEVVQVSRRFC